MHFYKTKTSLRERGEEERKEKSENSESEKSEKKILMLL